MLQQKKILFTAILCLFLAFVGVPVQAQKVSKISTQKVIVDTAKTKAIAVDSIKPRLKVKAFKSKAHASYYANKFNGKRTSSGIRFDNNKYSAAHRKLPFGTKLKVTNEENGKWVIVEVIDRGPFSRGREIDLSKRAFMEIVSNKNSGSTIVKLEIIEN
jgi:rare lipoprotein A